MKHFLVVLALLAAVPLYAKGTKTINASCDKAIEKAEVIAAQRKWQVNRADPNSPVLNISTSTNVGKALLCGVLCSHSKQGELTLEKMDNSNTCRVSSNGKPADVVLGDLMKTFGSDSTK